MGEDGRVLRPATINCTIPEILRDIKAGEQVWFDDGKIGGVIKKVADSEATIEITHASAAGSKLRSNKGINLPDSDLSIASLTTKDLEDLQTVAEQADIVGMSFVRSPGDVEALDAHLARLGRPDIGILLKIETRQAFDNLPFLVLAAMRRASAGVMIARGDLAVECGYERMAEIQEEILWVCEAAHMPVVWATQVLENLAKTGVPSRAEITDAAMGERAECVMLNKGPHLCDAVKLWTIFFSECRVTRSRKAQCFENSSAGDLRKSARSRRNRRRHHSGPSRTDAWTAGDLIAKPQSYPASSPTPLRLHETWSLVPYMDPAPSAKPFAGVRVKPVAAIYSASLRSFILRSGP